MFGNKLWGLESYKQITKSIFFCFRRNIVSNWIPMKVLTSFGDRQAEPNAQNSSQQHKYIKFHGYDCINFRCRLKIKLNTHNILSFICTIREDFPWIQSKIGNLICTCNNELLATFLCSGRFSLEITIYWEFGSKMNIQLLID